MTVCAASCAVDGNTVTLRGELDLATLPDLEAALTLALAPSSASDLLVDLSGATFVDLVSLGAFLAARNEAEAAGRRLRLRGVSPRLERVLGLFAAEPPFDVVA